MVISLVFSLAAAAPSAEQPDSLEPLDIGSRLELFVDDYLIESTNGVELKLHSPQPAERVLSFNREWEGGNSGYVTVFQDSGRYRMYYRGASSTGYIVPSLSKPGEVVIPEHPQVACYAESLDGIIWKRPSLGLYEFNGSQDNNIVWTGSGGHNFSPFRDINPAAPPAERYKAVGSGRVGGKPVLREALLYDPKRRLLLGDDLLQGPQDLITQTPSQRLDPVESVGSAGSGMEGIDVSSTASQKDTGGARQLSLHLATEGSGVIRRHGRVAGPQYRSLAAVVGQNHPSPTGGIVDADDAQGWIRGRPTFP